MERLHLGLDHDFCTDIIDHASDLIHLVDCKGNFLYVNKSWKEKFGYTEKDLEALNVWDIIHPQNREYSQEVFQKAMSGVRLSNVEAVFIDKGGKEIHVEGSMICRFAHPGQAQNIYGIFREVFSREQVEEDFSDEDEKKTLFRYVAEFSPLPLAIVDTDGSYEYLNPEFTKVFGYTRADLATGRDWFELAYPDPHYRREVIRVWRQDLEKIGKENIRPRTFSVTCKNGSLKEIFFRPVLMANGKHLIIYEDITERKMAAEKIEEKNRMLSILNQYTTEQAEVDTYDRLVSLIAEQLIEYSGAVFTTFSEYVSRECLLIPRNLKTDQKLLNIAARFLGKEILPKKIPFSDNNYRELTTSIVGFRSSFAEISEGLIAENISKALHKATGIYHFVYLAHVVEKDLYGVSVLAFRHKNNTPSLDFLRSYAYITAISLRRLQAEERVRFMGFHDQLTGLYNRYYLNEEINRLDVTRQLPFSIVMADLNGLKLINDTYGHLKGDEVIKKVASILGKTCRAEDVIARWGGDEFVILLPGTKAQEAAELCKRIDSNCHNVYVDRVPVSVATGAATKTEAHIKMIEVLREAEDNMYKQKLTESRSTKSAVLRALLKTLAEKSFETEAHTQRMKVVAQKIGQQLKLTNAELNRLDLLITLHDIGKINISEEILKKVGPLTAVEWETIKKHPEIGFRIARATEEFAHVAEDIIAHHERWDGKGYPQGLQGSKIPLLARITAIADAYEVMSNGRPYKKAMSKSEIITEIKRCSGTQFDPDLVHHFLEIIL